MKSIYPILVGSLLTLTACDKKAEETPFQEACIEEIKSNLKAPASFVLVDARNKVTDYVFEDGEIERDRERYEYLETLSNIPREERTAEQAREVLNSLDESMDLMIKLRTLDRYAGDTSRTPAVYSTTVQYDAQNGFGALLRGEATCTYNAWNGRFDGSESTLLIELDM